MIKKRVYERLLLPCMAHVIVTSPAASFDGSNRGERFAYVLRNISNIIENNKRGVKVVVQHRNAYFLKYIETVMRIFFTPK
jgi:hypothetical protein